MRLSYATLVAVMLVLTAPLWIMPLLQILVLSFGALVWLVVLISELVGL